MYIVNFVEANLSGDEYCSFNATEYRLELAKRLLNLWRSKSNESLSEAPERPLLDCNTFKNGLIQRVVYYTPPFFKDDEKDVHKIVVCVYGQGLNRISGAAFGTLVDSEGWFENSVIDAAISTYMDKKMKETYLNVLCIHAT